MRFVVALTLLAVVLGVVVVYWRTSPRHRVVASHRADHGHRARHARVDRGEGTSQLTPGT